MQGICKSAHLKHNLVVKQSSTSSISDSRQKKPAPVSLGQTWQWNKNRAYKTVNGETMGNEFPGAGGSFA